MAAGVLNYFYWDPSFRNIVNKYDVIILKHCSPASDILEDIGEANPLSEHQSLANYKKIYQHIGRLFTEHPNKLFIVWTLPPRHRLYQPLQGEKELNAVRAKRFSNWLKTDFLKENTGNNVFIWDFRSIVTDPKGNFLKYEYEIDHGAANAHPNDLANIIIGTQFTEFITESVANFFGKGKSKNRIRIIFLHHSIGLNVYNYPSLGASKWFTHYNTSNNTKYMISHKWYPRERNMPLDYYRRWCN